MRIFWRTRDAYAELLFMRQQALDARDGMCVWCGVGLAEHADIRPSEAPAGVCPRYTPPAPHFWLTHV